MTGQISYYLSGPMAGYPDNNFPAFQHAEDTLTGWGMSVLSPHQIDHGATTEWSQFLSRDIATMLACCSGVILLRGWPQSRGARLELATALALDWPVSYFDGSQLHSMNREEAAA